MPIVEDKSIEIGEVWLPPLKNDSKEILGPLEADDFLAQEFFDDETDTVLFQYLWDKARHVEELQTSEREVVDLLRKGRHQGAGDTFNRLMDPPNYGPEGHTTITTSELWSNLREASNHERIDMFRTFFADHEADADARTGTGLMHESASYDSRYEDPLEIVASFEDRWDPWSFELRYRQRWELLCTEFPDRARVLPAALSTIRKSAANGAITATHVAKVAEALRNRRPPIRPLCRFIPTGQPSRFVWSPSKEKFVRCEKGGESGLVLTLLGPSEGLIEKHSAKLPIGQYAFCLMRLTDAIHTEHITPSNQLSYIFTLEMNEQRILISGDAGCYGFKKKRGGDYYEELLRPLAPLQVIQIAHHAGHNYDFYNALLAATFAEQQDSAFLLVSHEKHDRYRPSPNFGEFIARLRRDPEKISLLFTSVPTAAKVDDYRALIHPCAPIGAGSAEGDIRLSYQDRTSGWRVDQHAITV